MKLTQEQKEELIKDFDEERPYSYIAKKYNLNERNVRLAKKQYLAHGVTAIIRPPSEGRYSKEFKEQIINEYKSGLSLDKITFKYNISKSTIAVWVRKDTSIDYNVIEEFRKNNNMSKENRKKELSNTERDELKELRKKNKHLEMENEVLKKLHALIQQREKQESKKK